VQFLRENHLARLVYFVLFILWNKQSLYSALVYVFQTNKSVNSVLSSKENNSDNSRKILLNPNNFKYQQLTTIIIQLTNIIMCVTKLNNSSK